MMMAAVAAHHHLHHHYHCAVWAARGAWPTHHVGVLVPHTPLLLVAGWRWGSWYPPQGPPSPVGTSRGQPPPPMVAVALPWDSNTQRQAARRGCRAHRETQGSPQQRGPLERPPGVCTPPPHTPAAGDRLVRGSRGTRWWSGASWWGRCVWAP